MRSAPGVIQACGVAETDLHSSAIHASEDAARRRFAAVRTAPGSADRTQSTSRDLTLGPKPKKKH